MIAKRGNILWIPSYQEDMNNMLNGTMMMGIDTSSKGNLTMMAACGTINSTFSLMTSSTRKCQGGGEGKFNDLLYVSEKCIEGYVGRNKSPPAELIIFMNATPGDQINQFQELFCKSLVAKVNRSYQTNMKLCAVMVNLRNS